MTEMMTENEAYVLLLEDTLKKKKEILLFLLEQTKRQQKALVGAKMDADVFESVLKEKKVKIDELAELDEGFDSIFSRVGDEMRENKEKYKQNILNMQALIKEITDLSMQIQTLEHKNSERFKLHLSMEKSQIRDVKMSSKMATSYYQNMANQHQAQDSYFFNQKK